MHETHICGDFLIELTALNCCLSGGLAVFIFLRSLVALNSIKHTHAKTKQKQKNKTKTKKTTRYTKSFSPALHFQNLAVVDF